MSFIIMNKKLKIGKKNRESYYCVDSLKPWENLLVPSYEISGNHGRGRVLFINLSTHKMSPLVNPSAQDISVCAGNLNLPVSRSLYGFCCFESRKLQKIYRERG